MAEPFLERDLLRDAARTDVFHGSRWPDLDILFDFHRHKVIGTNGNGREVSFDLRPMTVAIFHAEFSELVAALGGIPRFSGQPNEVPFPVPFRDDHRERPYDRDAVRRFHQTLMATDRVFATFRTAFLGKSSPVHLFWGALDLAVTRFSGRTAPLHPAGIPALPDDVAQEAYDREVHSVGLPHTATTRSCSQLAGVGAPVADGDD